MTNCTSTTNSGPLAVLGGAPAFPPGNPVPLIRPQGYSPRGDFSVIDAIIANAANEDTRARPSQQRFVAKILPGVAGPGLSRLVVHLGSPERLPRFPYFRLMRFA